MEGRWEVASWDGDVSAVMPLTFTMRSYRFISLLEDKKSFLPMKGNGNDIAHTVMHYSLKLLKRPNNVRNK